MKNLFNSHSSLISFIAMCFALISFNTHAGPENCFPTGLSGTVDLGDPPNRTLGIAGDFDLKICSRFFNQIVDSKLKEFGNPVILNSTGKFLSTGAAYHTEKYWDIQDHPQRLASMITETCQISGWNQIVKDKKINNPLKPSKYIVNQCANATYINALLYGEYGLFHSQPNDLIKSIPPALILQDGSKNSMISSTRGYLLQKYSAECSNCNSEYHAVIDAGSSGTRLFLYKVQYKPKGYPIVEKVLEFERDTVENGIDDYVDYPSAPGSKDVNKDVIDPLLAFLKQYLRTINKTSQNIRIDLFATAGMRNIENHLSKQGTSKAAVLSSFYENIKRNISEKGFQVDQVRTSDGDSEEGIWTWISINDHYNNSFKDPTRMSESTPANGIIEIGGASTQISYPSRLQSHPRNNVYRVVINGHTYNVFNKTYLGLGMDDARKIMLEMR